jgi:Recombination endonuclease VII/HNH endonuclease
MRAYIPSLLTLEIVMAYDKDVSLEALREMLTYNYESGEIFWLQSPARNIYAGELAGCVKTLRKNKNGEDVKYRYIRLNGCNIPAQRIAYALHNGDFPNGRITFVDGNPLNLKYENLQVQRSIVSSEDKRERDKKYYRQHRIEHGLSYKESDLKRYYGIGLLEYGKLLISQNGKCAICGNENGGHRNGDPKALAVDHDHTTGKVRGLLCEACNQGIGKLKEDVTILQRAIEYLNNHSSGSPVEDLGNPSPQTGLADVCTDYGDNPCAER